MATTKPENRIKKMKKSNKRPRKFVDNGESAEVANLSVCDDKHHITETNEDNVAGPEVKAHKSKRARKIKKKDIPVSSEHRTVVNNEEEFEPVVEDCLKGKKDKSKNSHKAKRKDTFVLGKQCTVVNDREEIEPEVLNCLKDKSKKACKSTKKDAPVLNEQSIMNDGDEIETGAEVSSQAKKGKSKMAHKKRKDSHSINTEIQSVQEVQEVAMNDVYQISSGEDDETKGMKKWITEYQERRPGLKVLQEQIDDFITAQEEQEEQAKREREAKMSEEGWTVVVHRKGGKKTTDSESGVAVGSVAEVAVRDKMAKKKSKDVGLDFYRFQRKEAHRSEIMKLQSKFEEDKKRIQQIRAARKFRPY